ncbi:glycoside hydrolase family 44 protein [Cohnella faecalis]|nr:glycoside hydrolase family 44 protein [Cohnella faecalis]
MKIKKNALLTGTMAALLLLSPFSPASVQKTYGESTGKLVVYDDSLSGQFADYGWAESNLGETGTVHSGDRSIKLDADEGQALYFYKDRVMNAGEYGSFSFWVHGGDSGGQKFKLTFSLGGQAVAEIDSSKLLPQGVPQGEWKQVVVPLEANGVRGIIDGIWVWGSGSQEPFYIDDMLFSGSGSGTGGSNDPQSPEATLAGISFGDNQWVLKTGGLRSAPLNAVWSDGTTNPLREGVVWSLDDESVASVSNGLVTGLKAGTTVLRAAFGDFRAELPLTVVEGQPAPPIEEIVGEYLYDDALASFVSDYSGVAHDLNDGEVVHTGVSSIRIEPNGDSAAYFYSGRPITGKEYEKLRLWINGGEAGGQEITLKLTAGGQPVAEFNAEELVPGGLPAGEWAQVELPLTASQLFDGILIAGAASGAQPAFYVDDIAIISKKAAQARIVELRIDKPRSVLLPGETGQLQAETYFAGGDTGVPSGVKWSSDKPDIVSVDSGELTASAIGIAKITAEYKEFRAEAYVQVTETASELVYEDSLTDGYRNFSWHDKDFANREQAHSGAVSIKFEPDGWDGVWISGDKKLRVEQYYGFRFWIHGGTTGAQKLLFHVYDGQSGLGAVDLSRYFPEGGLKPGVWTPVTVNFADLGLSDGQFDGIIFQASTEDNQGTVYVDDISLLRNLHAGELPEPVLPALGVTIDTSSDRKSVNPEIYGINYDDMHPTESTLSFPVQRWGGNQTTRYNWQLDTANRANDWYYINYPYDNDNPGALPNGSTSDLFIDGVRAKGGQVLLTVPTIGWTPKDREIRSGFSVKKYGAQQSVAQERPDAGNGLRPDGTPITGNSPTDTSKPIGPEFVTGWMDHIKNRTGEGVHYYALDNEPEIWNSTHRDVHPNPPTYDEIWNFTKKYGAAIKAKDSSAKVFGPVSWGWCAYFYSSADVCADGPDRQSHEGAPFLEWYLQQLAKYEKTSGGTRLVDYLDIHYYSQEDGVPTDEEGPTTVKRRFQALKSLYDPNFIDQSWIQEPINLIPRMKDIIDRNLPGMKLALTEYNFGNGRGISAGIAQAEALAIFGREGVDLATRFGTLPAGTPLEDAFKLYLNYDGQGSKIEGTSVKTVSDLPDAVGAYTIEGSNGQLYVLLFNKDTVTREVHVGTGDDAIAGAASMYRFDARQRLSPAGQVSAGEEGKLTVKLPSRSATLLVVPTE